MQAAMLRAALLGCLLAAATAPAPIARAGNATRARRRLSVDYQEVAKLVASDGAGGDYFGYSVAIDSATVVVGAPADGGYSGAVYVSAPATAVPRTDRWPSWRPATPRMTTSSAGP